MVGAPTRRHGQGSESEARSQYIDGDVANRRHHATNEMLRQAGGAGRVIVHVVQPGALRFQMNAGVALLSPIDGGRDQNDELRHGEHEHHRAQHPSLQTTH